MIPVNEPLFISDEKKYLAKCIDTGWISSEGPFVKEFEEKFSAFIGKKYGIAVSSGTAALEVAVGAINIKPGEEVITPTFTIISCPLAVISYGGIPVFVDSEPETWNINVSEIEEKITKKTKAIMVVHIYGHSCDMDPIMKLAKKYNLKIIEDAAEVHGAEYRGKKCGSFGDLSCFSFYANKIISCFPPETHISIKPPKGKKGLKCIKRIGEVKIGDEVLSYNERTGEKEYDTVVRTYKRKARKLIKIKLSNGNELLATPNHPIFIINKGWVPISEIKTKDEIIQYRYRHLGYRLQYLYQKGKSYEDIYGKKRAIKIKRRKNEAIGRAHRNPNSRYSIMYTDEWKKKIGNANRGRKFSLETRKKMSKRSKMMWREIKKNPKRYKIIIQKLKETNNRPELREKRRVIALNLAQDPNYIKKLSRGVIKAQQKREYWEKYGRDLNLKPNKTEIKLWRIIDSACPNEFSYNGDFRLRVTLDRVIPDFVSTNGKKKLIDLLGSHWHSRGEEKERISRYKKLGYDSLMVWDYDLKDKESLRDKIKTFVYNPNVEIVKVVSIDEVSYNSYVYNLETAKNHNYFAYGILVHNCGEGGMILTDNKKYAERARGLRNLGFGKKKRFRHQFLARNYRMTNLQAALGVAQMKNIKKLIEIKRENAKRYTKRLRDVPGLQIPIQKDWAKNVYWMYGIVLDESTGYTGESFSKELFKRGIEVRPFFYPLHLQRVFKKMNFKFTDKYPVAERIAKQGLYLPSGLGLKDKQIDEVCRVIKKLLK